jgi:chemotaxis protein MotB
LESLVAAKEAAMHKLKETLSSALNSFEGKGLTVEQKNGKCMFLWKTNYCLAQESWSVGSEGKKSCS